MRTTVRHIVLSALRAARGVARASLLGPLACISILAADDAGASAYDIIAPGQEPLLAEMLGRGANLPGACTFSNGQVESALVRSTYRCPGGTVVVELRHSSQTEGAVAATDRFAIAVPSGSPPADLIAALVARVREREAAFVWASPGSEANGGATSPFAVIHLNPRMTQAAWVILILASPVLCWRGGHAVGVAGTRVLLAVTVSVLVAAAVTSNRADEPLHANGHAWREAREVLVPWGARSTGGEPFLHGHSAIALQWLIASVEQRVSGTANPFRISRWAGAAAAGATAFLAMVLARSWLAGLAAGCALALMPLAQMLALSGSPLAIPEWILPWTLGLLIAAGLSGDRVLLAAAALAAGLGTLSHTAMLAWPPALLVAWLIVARRRLSLVALAAFLLLVVAWFVQLSNVFEMVASRNQGPSGGLLSEAWRGMVHRNLLVDPQWVSPVLLPLVLLWVLGSVRRRHLAVMLASVAPLLVVAAPFFAVTQSSSDAVRYQSALLGLITGLAVAGLWRVPFAAQLGTVGMSIMRVAMLATLVLLPPAAKRPPADPVTVEHQLVADALGRMEPGTLVILPKGRFDQGRIIPDFPDFMLPENSRVVFEGDPRIEAHTGQRLAYLGLACISWNETDAANLNDLRPECRALRSHAQPLAVRTLRAEDLPRSPDGSIWTFHRLATDVPFGFFALDP